MQRIKPSLILASSVVVGTAVYGRLLRRANRKPDGSRRRSVPGLARQDTGREGRFLSSTSPERINWHFIPRDRLGIPLKELTPEQRALAFGLIPTGAGGGGYLKATTIMSLEQVFKRSRRQGPGPRSRTLFPDNFRHAVGRRQVGLARGGPSPVAQLRAREWQDRRGDPLVLRRQSRRGAARPAPGPAHPGRPRGHAPCGWCRPLTATRRRWRSSRRRPRRRFAPPERPNLPPTPRRESRRELTADQRPVAPSPGRIVLVRHAR